MLRDLRIIRRGRPGPGWAVCARCRDLVAHADLAMVARPGRTKGVYWCSTCVNEITGGDHVRPAP